MLGAEGICATGFKYTQGNAHCAKFESNTNRMTFEYAPNMTIVKVHPLSKLIVITYIFDIHIPLLHLNQGEINGNYLLVFKGQYTYIGVEWIKNLLHERISNENGEVNASLQASQNKCCSSFICFL